MIALARHALAIFAPLLVLGGSACGGSIGAGADAGASSGDGSAPRVTAIAAGAEHTCVLFSNGTVECWGDNSAGELGAGTSTGPETCDGSPCSTVPVTVSGLSGMAAIATGSGHDCALLTDGTVACWGDNSAGELGAGTTTGPQTCFDGAPCSATPVAVPGLSGVIALAAGAGQTCALLAGGTVDCWGDNAYGELGEGTTAGPQACVEDFGCSTAPVAVPGLNGVTALAAGAEHTCALLSNGTVECWGDNTFGELGDGSILGPEQCRGGNPTGSLVAGDGCSTTPVTVSGLSGVVALAAAGWETCALLSGGTLACWGYDEYDGLTGATSADLAPCAGGQCAWTPIAVPGLSGVTAVAPSGEWQTCALLTGETVECWGHDAYGELGDGTSTGITMCAGYPCLAPPVAVPGLRDVTAIAVGEEYGCALLSTGAVECWGGNEHGELGTGTSTGPETCNGLACSTTPVAVSGL